MRRIYHFKALSVGKWAIYSRRERRKSSGKLTSSVLSITPGVLVHGFEGLVPKSPRLRISASELVFFKLNFQIITSLLILNKTTSKISILNLLPFRAKNLYIIRLTKHFLALFNHVWFFIYIYILHRRSDIDKWFDKVCTSQCGILFSYSSIYPLILEYLVISGKL